MAEVALEAVCRFIANQGWVLTRKAWTDAWITPSERTITRKIGSFAADSNPAAHMAASLVLVERSELC